MHLDHVKDIPVDLATFGGVTMTVNELVKWNSKSRNSVTNNVKMIIDYRFGR